MIASLEIKSVSVDVSILLVIGCHKKMLSENNIIGQTLVGIIKTK